MPSHVHEALIELFRQRPALAAELLCGQLGVPVPAYAKVPVLTDPEETAGSPELAVLSTMAHDAGARCRQRHGLVWRN